MAGSPTVSVSGVVLDLAYLGANGCDSATVITAVKSTLAAAVSATNGDVDLAALKATAQAVLGVSSVAEVSCSVMSVDHPTMVDNLVDVAVTNIA